MSLPFNIQVTPQARYVLLITQADKSTSMRHLDLQNPDNIEAQLGRFLEVESKELGSTKYLVLTPKVDNISLASVTPRFQTTDVNQRQFAGHTWADGWLNFHVRLNPTAMHSTLNFDRINMVDPICIKDFQDYIRLQFPADANAWDEADPSGTHLKGTFGPFN